MLHGLPGGLVAGKVDDGVDPVIVDDAPDRLTISDVARDEWRVADGGSMTELHCVEYDDVATSLPEESDGVGADIAGSAGHENGHPLSIAYRYLV